MLLLVFFDFVFVCLFVCLFVNPNGQHEDHCADVHLFLYFVRVG